MKKRLCILVAMILLVAFLGPVGCGGENGAYRTGKEFLDRLASGDYAGAYAYLHQSVKYREQDMKEGETPPSKRISEEQFVKRYTDIFQQLGITGLTYTLADRKAEGDAVSIYDYQVQYQSELYEPEPMNWRISLRKENGAWWVEWTPAFIFEEMEWGDTVRVGTLRARRGEILADGRAYAMNVNAVSICAVQSKIEDKAQFARQLSLMIDLPVDTILKRLDTDNELVVIKQMYPDEYTEALETELLMITGVSIDNGTWGVLRTYPQGSSLAHIIGYVGHANEEDLERLTGSKKGDTRYNSDSRVGKTGLERQYEEQLRGTDGYYVYIQAAGGENKKTLFQMPAQNGQDLQLSIKPDVQEEAELLLKYSLYGEDTAGAVVVLNPKTGGVEAMASYPSYDLNAFARGISNTAYQRMINQANNPLLNRLTQGRYAPGSTFKPFTAAAALHTGSMTPSTAFPARKEKIEDNKWRPSDTGEFGPWRGAVITRVQIDHRHDLDMRGAMLDSDNIYFAYSALRTGISGFLDYIEPIGFTEAIPFDLPVQKAQLANENSEWTPMLLAATSFGQGEVLMTPLQAAAMFSVFANNGSIMRPYVVEGLYRENGTEYERLEGGEATVWKESVISQEIINTLLPMLVEVNEDGTGEWLGLKRELKIAGKTGTTQLDGNGNRELAWYVGFRAEGDNPRLVLVMLELPANVKAFSMTKFDIARPLLRETVHETE